MGVLSDMLRSVRRHDDEYVPLAVAEIDDKVHQLFTRVADGVATATAAFLSADREAARTIVAADQKIDELQRDIEELVQRELLVPHVRSADDMRLLLIVVRIVPELERSGDLVEHIALRTGKVLTDILSEDARRLIEEMGRTAASMWEVASDAYGRRDFSAADRLDEADDQLDDLHVRLTTELSGAVLPTSIAIELGLVARFFERLGDHAVNVTRRLRDLDPLLLTSQG